MTVILNFLPTMQCLKYFFTTPLCPAYLKTPGYTPKNTFAFIMAKIISIYCLTLDKWRPSWILPTMQCKIVADHTTKSGIPENPTVNTKSRKLLLFCRNICQFKVWPSPNSGHFEFVQFSQITQDIWLIWIIDPMRVWNPSKKKTLIAGAWNSLMAAWLSWFNAGQPPTTLVQR